jgi:exopolyphosphatase/guanosine-5'-triphosphate,3'-diphosphate pyrophosphatase
MPSVQRIAIVDIGSNSIKLLVADFTEGKLKQTVHFETDDTRIGGFLGSGSLEMTEEAIRAGIMSVEKLIQLADTFHPDHTAIVATSAVREAENRSVFCDWIERITGIPVKLLSGEAEAAAIARGVRCDPALADEKEFYMLDQGGGSLEIIHWHEEATDLVSLPLGAVRLFKQFQHSDLGPVNAATRQQIEAQVDQHWNLVPWLQHTPPSHWVGTGGALTLVRSLLAERAGIDFEASSPRLSYDALSEFYHEIATLPVAERMAIAQVPASRADILPVGLIAILRIMERAGTPELIHSFYNLRYGYAAQSALAIT